MPRPGGRTLRGSNPERIIDHNHNVVAIDNLYSKHVDLDQAKRRSLWANQTAGALNTYLSWKPTSDATLKNLSDLLQDTNLRCRGDVRPIVEVANDSSEVSAPTTW